MTCGMCVAGAGPATAGVPKVHRHDRNRLSLFCSSWRLLFLPQLAVMAGSLLPATCFCRYKFRRHKIRRDDIEGGMTRAGWRTCPPDTLKNEREGGEVKKQWQRPQLVVLVRPQLEEKVLLACKQDPQGGAGSWVSYCNMSKVDSSCVLQNCEAVAAS